MPENTGSKEGLGPQGYMTGPPPPRTVRQITGGGRGGAASYIEAPNPAYAAWERREQQARTAAAAAAQQQEQARRDAIPASIKETSQRAQGYEQATEQRQAPQVADSPVSAQQTALGQLLMQMATGGLPSLAAMQVNQARNAALANQTSMANSARPDLAGFAQHNAARNAGMINLQAAQDSAMAQLAERNAAVGALGQLLGQQRGQDLQLGGMNAGLAQQMTGMNDQRLLELLRQQLGAAGMEQQGGQFLQQLLFQQQQLELQRQQLANQPGFWERLFGTTIGPGLTLLGGVIGGPPGAAAGGALGGQLAGAAQGGGGARMDAPTYYGTPYVPPAGGYMTPGAPSTISTTYRPTSPVAP